jgi:uncharacterized protein
MYRVTHFEIPADEPEKTMDFYASVFGWKFTRFAEFDYWLADTGSKDKPGINGAVMARRDPQQPVTNSIEVDNIDTIMEAVPKSGGTLITEKMPIVGVGWLVFFRDPGGCVFGAMQPDPDAK